MHVEEALSIINKFDLLALNDKTFEPQTVDQVILDSGETVWWSHGVDGTWLSIDPASEELIQFTDVDEELVVGKDIVGFAGDEYEFSYESTARIMSEDGEEERVAWREYESTGGELIRLLRYEVSGDEISAHGHKIALDAIHEG